MTAENRLGWSTCSGGVNLRLEVRSAGPCGILESAVSQTLCRWLELFLGCLAPSELRAIVKPMTDLLERAVAAARNLPSAAQDDIARIVLSLAGTDDEATSVALSPEEQAAIAASKAEAARGEFATDEQVRAVWAKHGL